MEIRQSAEDYLETILVLKKRLGQVRSIDIANEMGFSKPSVSYAMKKLRENSYITVDDSGLIALTDTGLAVAERIYERHRFLSSYFMEIGIPEDIALEDACKIEHVLSDVTFQKLRAHYDAQQKNKG